MPSVCDSRVRPATKCHRAALGCDWMLIDKRLKR
jgi:hypothetical protein